MIDNTDNDLLVLMQKVVNLIQSSNSIFFEPAKYMYFQLLLNSTLFCFTKIPKNADRQESGESETSEKGEKGPIRTGLLVIRDQGKKIKNRNLKNLTESVKHLPENEQIIDPKSVKDYIEFIPCFTSSDLAWRYGRNLQINGKKLIPHPITGRDFFHEAILAGKEVVLNPGHESSKNFGATEYRYLFSKTQPLGKSQANETPEGGGTEEDNVAL
jgi:hypothetical protein